MTHLTFEEINELADGRTRPGAYPSTGDGQEPGHLESCAECRDTLRRVRALIAAAQALPRDVAPPPEVWDALQRRVSTQSRRRARSKWWVGGWVAAAAAIVLLVGSAVLMPPAANKMKGAKLPPTSTEATPAMLAVEQNYVRTVAELRATLDQQRGTLSPSTIRVLERSLATIDTAIAEARAALASDPANQTLVEILSANYEHKLELLQRATQLSPST